MRWTVPALVVGGLLAVTGFAFASSSRPGAATSKRPQKQSISLLYVLKASEGTLVPLPGQKGRFTLTLRRVDPDLVWFSDRPARDAGVFPARGIVKEWRGFGFTSDPPNAALVFKTSEPDAAELIVELSGPRSTSNGVSFQARLIDPNTVTSGNLASHARAVETDDQKTPPARFAAPILFVDDSTAPTFKSCVIQPYAGCEGANLSGANLSGVDLSGVDLSGANLSGANLSHANLGGCGNYCDTYDAGTNLSGANITNTNLTGATFCGTIMPNGSINNRNC